MNLKGLPNIAIATGNGLVSSWGKAFENQTYQNQTTPSNTTNVLSEDTRAWEVMSDSTIDWQIVNEIAGKTNISSLFHSLFSPLFPSFTLHFFPVFCSISSSPFLSLSYITQFI